MSHLTPDQVNLYETQGFLSPLTAFSAQQAQAYRTKLEAFEGKLGQPIGKPYAYKPHLLLPWVEEIARTPAILDAIEDLIGSNILLFHITCWPKAANDLSFVSWHQDSTTFGLHPNDQHVTAWVALSESNLESGCVQAFLGSHKQGQLDHHSGTAQGNMLGWGQTVQHEIDGDAVRNLVLHPGQFSLHHTHVLHNSPPNRSADRRIGFGLSYIPTHVRCTSETRVTAMLMRGVDEHGYYQPEPSARSDDDAAAAAFHAESVARFSAANNEQARRLELA